MRLEQLEYLVGVARHGSLRRAGEALHVSQPALSEALTKLERELGVTLLDRRRAGTRVSREGRELLGPVTDVLDAADRLRGIAGDQRGGGGTLRVGTVNTATSSLVAPAVSELQTRHRTTVELIDLRQHEIEAGLVEGTLDLGLVNHLADDPAPERLQTTTLLTGRPVVVLPGGHDLAGAGSVTLRQLRAEPFVSMREGYVMHRHARRLFGDRPPQTAWTTDGAAMGKQMVAEGLGLTLLPDYSVVGDPLHRAGLITTLPVDGDTTTVSLLLLRRRGLDRVPVRALVGALRDRARLLGATEPGPALRPAPTPVVEPRPSTGAV